MSNGQEYRYVYDDLGQLIREDNSVTNKTYVYAYDNAGNILSKKTYSLTAAGSTPSGSYTTNAYTYGDATWGDLLTKYRGVFITYDAIGNPLSYYNGSSYTFTWKNGRQLASATKGSTTLSFDYNDEGIRTKKVVNGVEHTYYLSGSQIEAEKWGNNLCIYIYDAEGAPIGMQYRNSSMAKDVFYTFWFEKNLQGDVIAVYNDSGVKVLVYTYDAWGNIYSTIWTNSTGNNIYAQYNPFRYRGYYYDSELEMYYLQSRYYDPAIGRFINADSQLNTKDGILGYNIYAYCNNNPVMNIDPAGNALKWWQAVLIGVAVIAIVAVTTAAIVYSGGSAATVLVAAGKIALSGVKIAAAAGAVAGTVRAGKAICEGETDVKEIGKDFITGFADGFFSGAMYFAGCTGASLASYGISGNFNDGYGWSSGQWQGGYLTPNTHGISIATHQGGVNGGRSFGVDMDIYNGLHYHTNKFGVGKKSSWIKTHHWEAIPIFIGIGVGLSDEWGEW